MEAATDKGFKHLSLQLDLASHRLLRVLAAESDVSSTRLATEMLSAALVVEAEKLGIKP